MATRDAFSEEELARLRGFLEITRAELIRYFTLTEPNETFVRQFRGPANILGAAVQLCTLPWLGFVPDDVYGAPAVAESRLAEDPAATVPLDPGSHARGTVARHAMRDVDAVLDDLEARAEEVLERTLRLLDDLA